MAIEQQVGTAAHKPVVGPAVPGRRKLQRSPWLVAVGVLVLAGGGVFGWFMWSVSSTASEVVAVRVDVDRGRVITAEDLTVVRVTLDPSLQTVPAAGLQALVGQRAASDLSAGTLVAPGQVTSELLPGTGLSVVAVPVASGLVPSVPVRAGDRVRLVQTPGQGGEVTVTPVMLTAEVVGITVGDSTTVVDVLVPSDRAAELAARAATGRVALVLDSRDR
jgi:hypothetical protein